MLRLCQQFSCTPSQLEQEDAEIIRLIGIVARGSREESVGAQGE